MIKIVRKVLMLWPVATAFNLRIGTLSHVNMLLVSFPDPHAEGLGMRMWLMWNCVSSLVHWMPRMITEVHPGLVFTHVDQCLGLNTSCHITGAQIAFSPSSHGCQVHAWRVGCVVSGFKIHYCNNNLVKPANHLPASKKQQSYVPAQLLACFSKRVRKDGCLCTRAHKNGQLE